MMREEPGRDEQVLKKLAELFVQIPEAAELGETADEFEVFDVDLARLSRRIREVIESVAERERLTWLEDYRRRGVRGEPRARRIEIPKARAERIRVIEELATAVGFKKLKFEALSDEDLARIIRALEEYSEC